MKSPMKKATIGECTRMALDTTSNSLMAAPDKLIAGAGHSRAAAAIVRRATVTTVEYTFDKSVPLGMTMKGNRIKAVDAGSQAEQRGVEVNGEIRRINHREWSGDINAAIVAAKGGPGSQMSITVSYSGKAAVGHRRKSLLGELGDGASVLSSGASALVGLGCSASSAVTGRKKPSGSRSGSSIPATQVHLEMNQPQHRD